MSKELLEYVKGLCVEYGQSDEPSKQDLWDYFECTAEIVRRGKPDERRWFTAYDVVYKINVNGVDRYFAYWIVSTHNESMDWFDCGWEYPALDSLVEVFPKEVVITVYVPKEDP